MSNRVCFIGHRKYLPLDIKQRLDTAIRSEIEQGCKFFTMGAHGDFDILSLSVCKQLQNEYRDIFIELIITSLHQIQHKICKTETGDLIYNPYENLNTVMYNIEDVYFKRKIVESNKQMINYCDTLICYVCPDKIHSGAKRIMNYAIQQGLRIINIY